MGKQRTSDRLLEEAEAAAPDATAVRTNVDVAVHGALRRLDEKIGELRVAAGALRVARLGLSEPERAAWDATEEPPVGSVVTGRDGVGYFTWARLIENEGWVYGAGGPPRRRAEVVAWLRALEVITGKAGLTTTVTLPRREGASPAAAQVENGDEPEPRAPRRTRADARVSAERVRFVEGPLDGRVIDLPHGATEIVRVQGDDDGAYEREAGARRRRPGTVLYLWRPVP